ncbi:MAG: hypothetical protein A3E87_00340 [Gammaproteobacteria bacterium RIFCSPHIGHO2_12_FULL_35_23]|nr:MAG: hypothetical protein A3E87_00340 [Gammaproteobacteria bacterium RIFCSPHIGHO2_12_FULL_35_23]
MHLFKKIIKLSQLSEPFRIIADSNPGQIRQIVIFILLASLAINLLSLAFPITLLQIYNRVIPGYAISTLIVLFLFVIVAMLLELVLKILRSTLTLWSDAKFEHYFGFKIINAILNLPLEIYHKQTIGTYLEHARQLTRIRNFYTGQALTAFLNVPFILIFLGLIIFLAGWLVLAPLLIIVIFLFITMYLAGHLKKYYDKEILLDEHVNNFLIDIFANIHTLKALALEMQINRRFERLYRYQLKKQPIFLYQHYLQISKLMSSQFMMIATVAAGAPFVIAGNITVGVLAACIILSSRCIQPLNEVFNVWIRLQVIKVAHKQLNTAFKLPSETQKVQHILENFQGAIELKNIELYSETTQQLLFRDLNLTIKSGQFIAINALSGAGRTAFLNLIIDNTKPTQGTVTLDNYSLEDLVPDSIRNHVRYLSPQSEIYQGTIIENLTLFDLSKIKVAKKIAEELGLSEYIQTLSNGYDTYIDTQSAHLLPQGIKQLVKLASAFADSNCKVLLLDAVNNGLDGEFEEKLINFFKKIKGQKTILFVSDKPSVLQMADETYTITHYQLLRVEH